MNSHYIRLVIWMYYNNHIKYPEYEFYPEITFLANTYCFNGEMVIILSFAGERYLFTDYIFTHQFSFDYFHWFFLSWAIAQPRRILLSSTPSLPVISSIFFPSSQHLAAGVTWVIRVFGRGVVSCVLISSHYGAAIQFRVFLSVGWFSG